MPWFWEGVFSTLEPNLSKKGYSQSEYSSFLFWPSDSDTCLTGSAKEVAVLRSAMSTASSFPSFLFSELHGLGVEL